MAVHANIAEGLASGRLVRRSRDGRIVSKAKQRIGRSLYKKYKSVMQANRAPPFSGGRRTRRRR